MGSVRWAVLEIAAPSAPLQLYRDPPTAIHRSSYRDIPTEILLWLYRDPHSPIYSYTAMRHSTTVVVVVALMFYVTSGNGQDAKTCKFKNKGKEYEANEGEVVQLKKTKLRVCENGKTVLKKKTEFKFPYNFACRGCQWYGEMLCGGAIVRDLYRWWFQAQCSGGRMVAVGRSLEEVVRDPRYKQRNG